ncbi:MAG: DUF1080 domain-containing protein [Planctomycetia bacterium]|nr:DUF1080 domain-containing protein [Planctomycetia bacterium]
MGALSAPTVLAQEKVDSGRKDAESINLASGDALAHWRSPTGDWFAAADARQSDKDEKLIAATAVNAAGSPADKKFVLVNGAAGRTVNLITKDVYGDIEAHLEFMIPKGSNSGVYFMGRYEIQILDSYGVEKPKYGDCGGIYQRWANNMGFEGHAPKENASRAPGEWQSFDVIFRAPRFDKEGKKTANARFVKVVHNGKLIHENVEVTGPTRAAAFDDEKATGPIMIQGDHGPVALRNFHVGKAAP